MKTKSFDDYLKTRLTAEEIDEIKQEAQLEADILRINQKILTDSTIEKNKIVTLRNEHIGSRFDDFLEEEGTLESAELAAIKMVIADQVAKEMKKKKLSQTEMAKRLGISRAAFMRLLNPKNYSV